MPAPKIFEMQIALYTVDNDEFSENRRGVCGGGGALLVVLIDFSNL